MRDITVYDKAKWHCDHESFPADSGEIAGGLYGGFFFSWAWFNGLLEGEVIEEAEGELRGLSERTMTPGQVFIAIGGVLASDLLTDVGNQFASHCFESDVFDYYLLFEDTLAQGLPSPYDVPDTWEKFDLLSVKLDEEFQMWAIRK